MGVYVAVGVIVGVVAACLAVFLVVSWFFGDLFLALDPYFVGGLDLLTVDFELKGTVVVQFLLDLLIQFQVLLMPYVLENLVSLLLLLLLHFVLLQDRLLV